MSEKNQVENPIGDSLSCAQSNNEIKLHKNNDLCPKIESLNISLCHLTLLPKIIFNLKHLTQLNLSNNYLMDLPVEIGNLHNLLTLNLSGNQITHLPKSVKYMHNLIVLDISCNDFSKVPDVLYIGLGVLRILDLSFNKISNFDCAPHCINTLTVLKLSCNRLLNLPKWVLYSLCQLVVLDIGGNCIFSDVQRNDFCTARVFESLQFLNVENCKINCTKMQFFSHFKNLEVLCMGNRKNKDTEYSDNYLGNFKMGVVKNFKILKCFYLQSVQISTLPLDFDCMKNLEVLDLSENLLSWLPECLCDLFSLKILNLTSNQLLFLPHNINRLINLKELHLGNNKLSFLPEGIYNLNNLEYVDFYNNNIEEIDFVIFKKAKLKGIDLELNCLQQNLFECECDVVKVKYQCLKNCLRQHFGYMRSRWDKQTPKTAAIPSSNLYNFYLSSCIEDVSDDEDSGITISQKHCQDNFNEENWEDQIIHVEEDDLFDPNEEWEGRKLFNLKEKWNFEFCDNYCPAYNHVPSFMETYAAYVVESSPKHKTVDGQFDSD